MKSSLTKIKAEMEFEVEEANSTRYVVLGFWHHKTNMHLYSMHPYAVIHCTREAFEEVTTGDLHAFKRELAEKCAENGNCNMVNLVSQIKKRWISSLPAIHCAVDIILEEDGGGDLWRTSDKVAWDYRIGVSFLEEIECRISQSLVAS